MTRGMVVTTGMVMTRTTINECGGTYSQVVLSSTISIGTITIITTATTPQLHWANGSWTQVPLSCVHVSGARVTLMLPGGGGGGEAGVVEVRYAWVGMPECALYSGTQGDWNSVRRGGGGRRSGGDRDGEGDHKKGEG